MTTQTRATLEEVAEEHSLDEGAFHAYCWNLHIREDYEDHVSQFEDCYLMGYTLEEYAEEVARDYFGDLVLDSGYFDLESYARDMTYSGDVYEVLGYLFRSY
jgi:hypothetical protein